MTEDLSSFVRLSISMVMLAALVSATLTLTVTGQNLFQSWIGGFTSKVNNASNTVLSELIREPQVSAAVMYRYISMLEAQEISSFEIELIDGTQVYNIEYLLENAWMNVSVTIQGNSNEGYDFRIREEGLWGKE